MPTWLVHGFRWPRIKIRIHIILQNLDDAAAEWLMAPATMATMTENFRSLYPGPMENLPGLRFIEQYDPEDETTKDQPYAYVCDQVHEVKLGLDIDEVRGQGVSNDAWGAMAELRDKVAEGEKVGWYVVVNGDVERWAPPIEDDVDGSQSSPISARSSIARIGEGGEEEEEEEDSAQTQRQPTGLRKWFSGKARKSKSSKDLRGDLTIRATPLSPPPPKAPPKDIVPVPSIPNGKVHGRVGSAS